MKHVRGYIIVLSIILSFSARAQQDIILTQQHLSRININPAATPVSNYANAFLIARQQWVGFQGAPSTQMFNAHGYISEIRSSLGLSIVNDVVGRSRNLNMMLNYAFHMQVGHTGYLAFGLGVGLQNRRIDGDLIFGEPEDGVDFDDLLHGRRGMRPSINFGITYSTADFAFGVSATNLSRFFYDEDDWFRLPLHIYAFMEYGFYIGLTTRFTPRVQFMSAMSSATTRLATNGIDTTNLGFLDRFDMVLDLGGTFSFGDRFFIGGSFRNDATFSRNAGRSVSAMLAVNLGPNFRIGYSYDHNLGNVFRNVRTFGSHEIMLNIRMRISEAQTSERTPRFFE